jgi:uncharacterized protein
MSGTQFFSSSLVGEDSRFQRPGGSRSATTLSLIQLLSGLLQSIPFPGWERGRGEGVTSDQQSTAATAPRHPLYLILYRLSLTPILSHTGEGEGLDWFQVAPGLTTPTPAPPRKGEGKAAALLIALLILLLPLAALAQSFPTLTGRVVDAANLLKPEERAALEAKLKAHEDKTSDQVVVATLRSLEGFEIEDYANRLFRHWQLGQKDKDNGALLLVAPQERKVRIEVGYGLEGALTDALSKIIITTAIAPQFQKGNFAGGIDAGADAMLSILTGDAEEWQRRAEVREDSVTAIDPMIAFVILLILFFLIARMMGAGRRRGTRRGRHGPWIVTTGGWGGGGGGEWSGGGGFSGGGGSSGGGGASGSW